MKIIEYISYVMIPMMIIVIISYGMIKKQKVYECFIEGVKEGLKVVINIFPTLIAIMIAIDLFRESGAMQILINIISPIGRLFGIPKEVVPLGIMSSLSGGASMGLLSSTVEMYGVDSLIGKIASTILGSSETTIYVLAVYTSAVNIKNAKEAMWIGLTCDFVAIFTAVWMCKLL
ncbi:MAG: spore maturation protein [Clostridia bacterium]|nr:spore maturation protein [Clostridia bacterium]